MPGRALAWLWLHEWEWVRSGGNTLAWFPLAFTAPCSSAIAFSPYVQSRLPWLLSQGLRPRSSPAGAARVLAGTAGVKEACDFWGDFLPKPHSSSMQVKPSRLRAAFPDWRTSLCSLSRDSADQTQRERPLGNTHHRWCLCPEAGSQELTSQTQLASQPLVHVRGGCLLEAATADLLRLSISTPASLIFIKDHYGSSHALTHNPECGHGAGVNIPLHLTNWLGFPFKIHRRTQEREPPPEKKSNPASGQSLLFDQWFSSALCWTRRMN